MATLSEFLKSVHPLSLNSFITDKTAECLLYTMNKNIPDLVYMRRQAKTQAVVSIEDIGIRGHTQRSRQHLWWEMITKPHLEERTGRSRVSRGRKELFRQHAQGTRDSCI